MPEETIRDIFLDIRAILREILDELSFGTKVGMDINDLVYERNASTLTNPVPAGAKKYELLAWNAPETTRRVFLLYGIGSDQHDNSYYYWIFDDTDIPQISGAARVGSIFEPLIFPQPIKIRKNIKLQVDNNNNVPYPNDSGSHPSDIVPYEGMFFGRWSR